MAIYIHREGRQYGPYSIEEAHDYIASGELSAEDLAWNEGAFAWSPLGQVIAASGPAEPREPSWVPPRRDGSGPLAKVIQPPQDVPDSSLGTPPVPDQPPEVPSASTKSFKAQQKEPRFINPYRMRGFWTAGIGGAIFVGGLLATALIHVEAAAKLAGWTHLAAWGAILFGGAQCISGLIQALRD